mmetsp:Transcript_7098/g.17145  ORF Transcript_7098/g.17145 Transcript_7098/m.17145 type:complete len:117 (+) Transcript_7098:1818-2168(+)
MPISGTTCSSDAPNWWKRRAGPESEEQLGACGLHKIVSLSQDAHYTSYIIDNIALLQNETNNRCLFMRRFIQEKHFCSGPKLPSSSLSLSCLLFLPQIEKEKKIADGCRHLFMESL